MFELLARLVAKGQVASRNERTIISIKWQPFGPHYAKMKVIHSELNKETYGISTNKETFIFRSL